MDMMSRTLLRTLAICFGVTLSQQAAAADIRTGTLPDGSTIVIVTGDFVASDIEVFKSKIAGVRKGVVALDSNGGSLHAGIQMGTAIRLRGLATVVPVGSQCASACAIAWLGGTPRMMGSDAKIGFHAAYRLENGAAIETGVGNALLGAYLSNLGLSDQAIVYVTMAAPSSMTWLSRREAETLGIDILNETEDRPPAVSAPRQESPAPASPAPTLSAEFLARQFAHEYFEKLGSYAGATSELFEESYAASVFYHNKTVPRGQIVREKVNYGARWPKRSYKWREETLSVSCAPGGQTCTVEGLVNWTARSDERRKSAAGVASMRLTIMWDGVRRQIIEEVSKVVAKDS
ncbi:hypothetical protein FHR70_003501 [Microvirga lupini]|uniref:Uncharacterized protein n=2 Tax=Microvirga lupini TaxID=420324 RepID=A0A7W4YXE0_9HYPH|nr:hypothetical protein [Microvirga lupini]